MKSKTIFSILSVVAVGASLFSMGCGKSEIAAASLSGKIFSSTCGTSGSSISRLNFTSETEVTVTTETYESSTTKKGCGTVAYTTDTKYTFTLVSMGDMNMGQSIYRMDMTLVSITITPKSDTGVTTLNTATMCEKTSWAKDTAVSILADLTSLADESTTTTCPAYNSLNQSATTLKFKKFAVGDKTYQLAMIFKENAQDGTSKATIVLAPPTASTENGLNAGNVRRVFNFGTTYSSPLTE